LFRAPEAGPEPTAVAPPDRLLEGTCIKALVQDPTLLHFINRFFREFELACVDLEDFSHTDHRTLFSFVRAALDQDEEEPEAYVRERIPAALVETILEDLGTVEYPDWRFQPNAPQLEDLLQVFMRLRRLRVDEGLDQIVYLQSQESALSEEVEMDFRQLALTYAQIRVKLDRALQQSLSHGKK
jgi:hypothetical protein